jgi:hypothetical protein
MKIEFSPEEEAKWRACYLSWQVDALKRSVAELTSTCNLLSKTLLRLTTVDLRI